MKTFRNKKSGQAMVEYMIIVVIVAVAALVIFGIFSDTIRNKMGGAIEELGGDTSAKDAALSDDAVDVLRSMDEDGAR